MANSLRSGDTVYVPCSAFPELADLGTALYRTEVVMATKKSVTVKLPDGAASAKIGVGRVHRDVGILVIEIGDFESEAATLDPLAKSVLQFCRLLVPDDQLRKITVRSQSELKAYWSLNAGAYTHVVLIGHGDTDILAFAVDGDVNAAALGTLFSVSSARPKTFISLACKTGYKSLGGEFSKLTICKDFIAPFHSVHGAVASQFCQTFLTLHLLDGRTTKVAFNKARTSVPAGVSFRLWHNGELHTR